MVSFIESAKIETAKTHNEHKIIAENRESVRISGVTEVLSFDEATLWCRTDMETLSINGDGFKVSNLNTDTGILDVTGLLNSITYENSAGGKSRGSVFGKIFK